MRLLYLLRHSLTEGNARHLYYGRTDLPLSSAGRALARKAARTGSPPPYGLYASSGMRRTNETLQMLTGRDPDRIFPDLREMNFGAFELRGYPELKSDPDYQQWIADDAGNFCIPGGESRNAFTARVLRGGEELIRSDWESAFLVTHGGVIATLMSAWFSQESRNFYQWQPDPCKGWRVDFDATVPRSFFPL